MLGSRCAFAVNVASVASATPRVQIWSEHYIAEYFAKLGYIRISSKFSVENHNKQVHNQSESFTVSEAGLAGGGEPVVKVSDKTL